MTHYVCTGDCAGEASAPGVCSMIGCSKEGKPLEKCDCEDGVHDDVPRDMEGTKDTSDTDDDDDMDGGE